MMIPVENQHALYRDEDSNAIVSTDMSEHKKYVEARRLKQSERTELDELKGEIMDTHEVLRELRREIIDQEATLKKTEGLLNTYTTAYNTVSRVVTLRTNGDRL